jgi:hypothetical protein
LIISIASWLGRFKLPECDLYTQIYTCLVEFFQKAHDDNGTYYGLITLGAITLSSESANKAVALALFGEAQLKQIVATAQSSANQAIQAAGNDLRSLFGFK